MKHKNEALAHQCIGRSSETIRQLNECKMSEYKSNMRLSCDAIKLLQRYYEQTKEKSDKSIIITVI